MNAEIICVGTEILLGDTINTNGATIAKVLAQLGIDIYHQVVVGDNHTRLQQALVQGFSRADMVITTGGLGPTYDDMTKDTVAKYFGKKLVYDENAISNIKRLFKGLDKPMTKNNLKQALVLQGATVLENEYGLAPGIYYEQDGKTVVMLPGPPYEMTPMLNNKLVPILENKSGFTLVSKNIRIFGIGESQVETTLRNLMLNSKNPTIAPYAKRGEVTVRVTAKAKTTEEGLNLVCPVVKEICSIFDENIYAIDTPDLQTALVEELIQSNKTIALAESCTGGMIASEITDVSGASEVFELGVVTYANHAKEQILGVKKQTLISYGAVSKETAIEMAQGIRCLSGADIGVSVTGIAGPTGGTVKKPVGLMYIAISTVNGTKTTRLTLSHGRKDERYAIRAYATNYALFLALQAIK